jgi:hypothetical protein
MSNTIITPMPGCNSRNFPAPSSAVRVMITGLFIALFFVIGIPLSAQQRIGAAQQQPPNATLMQCIIIDGDTFFFQRLAPFVLLSPKTFTSRRHQAQYNRLIVNVKRVYPYARLAGIKMEEYNDRMLAARSDRERKEIMKQAEADLEAQFGKELRNLTFSQGVILLKLIDRETGQTSYDLLSELRGTFRAFFWQGIGRIFGYNLKVRYDPRGTDKDIEDIVIRIMYGQL